MDATQFDCLCIGNAICDVLARAPEAFLAEQGLVKGSMRLIDASEAERLESLMTDTSYISGGCAGSTAVGIASLGGRAAYFGKVANDRLGKRYRSDMRAQGVTFQTRALTDGEPTARSLILITPDGERTMNTYLGACRQLSAEDVQADIVRASHSIYMEGFLWDEAKARAAFFASADIGRESGALISINLNDSFCVDRFRNEWLELTKTGKFDLIFANENELKALFCTDDLDVAISEGRHMRQNIALTLGARGAMVIACDNVVHVPAQEVDAIVDLTGAGDMFASGFLYALAQGKPYAEAARLGCRCSAEIIAQLGARPRSPLKPLLDAQ